MFIRVHLWFHFREAWFVKRDLSNGGFCLTWTVRRDIISIQLTGANDDGSSDNTYAGVGVPRTARGRVQAMVEDRQGLGMDYGLRIIDDLESQIPGPADGAKQSQFSRTERTAGASPSLQAAPNKANWRRAGSCD